MGTNAADSLEQIVRAEFSRLNAVVAETERLRDLALAREDMLLNDLFDLMKEWRQMGEENITAENAAAALAMTIEKTDGEPSLEALEQWHKRTRMPVKG